MFGIVQTPPRPSPAMPSLAPCYPLSGTVGVSPNHRPRRRGLKLTLCPTTESLSCEGQLSPAERLEQLTETIRGVLRSYAAQPARSLVYLASLKEFLRRALELDPATDNDERHDHDRDLNPSPSPLNMAMAGLPPPYRPKDRRGSKTAERLAVDKAELERLERDWWSSEVVVAWYGPRPGYRVLPHSRIAGRRESRESEREATIKRDASFVGLRDEYVVIKQSARLPDARKIADGSGE